MTTKLMRKARVTARWPLATMNNWRLAALSVMNDNIERLLDWGRAHDYALEELRASGEQ
jgi:hypothetical protein